MQELTTRRLRLRALNRSDYGFFCELISHPQVRRYLGGPIAKDQWAHRFEAYLSTTLPIWLVNAEGISIGIVTLTPHKDGQDFELSYQFLPDFWGRGYATEACQKVLEYALITKRLPCIIAETQSANDASCRLLSCLGLHEERRVERFGAQQIIFATPKRA
ncbi:GNAT family N-acetyltransferase [Tritonibacter mobilis]|uniref:N-acetyltransferase domain-containing protein n=1 Tax=Tritonibacter mobilis F1926 TaxID=1265309 RepID=A0A1B1A0M9_9RHOB|nr:GNAT family N-acetyltransferase [Tritonibacter mobilis]ANP40037.1 hypothetical protein K529_004590 [Tritonibacter mobilis F1926]